MRGVENIVRMRKSGVKPSVVFVEMLPMQKWARRLTDHASRYVDIHLTPKDVAAIELADLRCLTGVRHVVVNGPDDEQTERVARACFKAGATVVEAFFFDLTRRELDWIRRGMRISKEGEKTVWQQ